MGENARRRYMARTTSGERLDHGLLLAEQAMRAALREEGLPEDPKTEAEVRAAFRALRRRSRG